MPLIAFAWLWHRQIRPFPRWLLLVLALGMILVVFPAIREFRNFSGDDRKSATFAVHSYSELDNTTVSAVSEMGSSQATVAYTLDLVPSTRSYDYGLSYAYALLTVFPNLFWDVHPTIKRGVHSIWLVRTVNPALAADSHGLGFSFIAEAYLNFGWAGTPIALAIMGFAYSALSTWCRRRGDPGAYALMASTLAFVLFFPRSESAALVRALVWYGAIPYFFARALSLRGAAVVPRRTSPSTGPRQFSDSETTVPGRADASHASGLSRTTE